MHGPGPLVLVVEDDSSLRLLCRVNLELEGFLVREAETAEEARAAVDEERPAVALLDVHLGEEDSGELLDELKARGIPVALVTGSAEVEGLRERADEVLAKPFLPEALVATVRRLGRVGAQ
jgi:DNA-binding response OmpR family regulator